MSGEQLSPAVMPTSDSLDSLRQQLHELHPGNQKDKAAEALKVRKACQDFEAVFIGQLWKQMRSSIPKGGVLESKEQENYVSMFDQELSVKMARSGGIGLGDMLYNNLQDRLKNASKDTSSPKPMAPLHVAGGSGHGQGSATGMSTMESLTAMQQAEMLAQSIIKAHDVSPTETAEGAGMSSQTVSMLVDGLNEHSDDNGI